MLPRLKVVALLHRPIKWLCLLSAGSLPHWQAVYGPGPEAGQDRTGIRREQLRYFAQSFVFIHFIRGMLPLNLHTNFHVINV